MSTSNLLTASTLRKYLSAWFTMLLVAVANGAVRDLAYGRAMDELTAHQVSTAIGIPLLGVVIWRFVRRYPPSSGRQAVFIGTFWMCLTIAFEFLFFHYAGGRPWSELLGNYDVTKGRVWVFVLLWVAIAPYLFYRVRRPA